MRTLWGFLRVYSYIFETILCVMGLLVCGFGLALKLPLHLGWLPWSSEHLLAWVLSLSLLGLIAVALATLGRSRALLVLFSAAVVYLLLRGLFLNTQYRFSGPADARNSLWLVLGAVAAFIGSWPLFVRRR
ncbi:hypothetical protein [Nevskia soli]|uniref:hypothetical protein n=1 Tax=Nevskia soli TaxID=418856 RepID=UPI0015D7111A|nr:hypothetical protein [Nevskia soli]